MITSEMAVFTKGWTAGQRVNLLKEAVKEYGCDEFFPWKELLATDFFVAPASTKYHSAYAGGLFDHSFNVANVLCYLTGTGMTAYNIYKRTTGRQDQDKNDRRLGRRA